MNLDTIKAEAAMFQRQKARVVTPEQRAGISALALDLPSVWRASTTEPKDRKRMLRQVILHIRRQGGACSDTTVDLPRPC